MGCGLTVHQRSFAPGANDRNGVVFSLAGVGGSCDALQTLHSCKSVIGRLESNPPGRFVLSASLITIGLLAAMQNVTADGVVPGAPSPSTSAEWACALQTSTGQPVEVNVTYDASNREVAVDIPSLRHRFARTAEFDSRHMMWTEDPEVGRAVLWTVVRATLEIRLTRIIGSTPRVTSGHCQVRPGAG